MSTAPYTSLKEPKFVSKEHQDYSGRPWCERAFSNMATGSLRASIFTYCSSIIGAGLLSLPFAISKCGLGLGIILIVLGSLIFGVFYWVLCDCCDIYGIYDYDAVVQKAFGEVGRRFTEISIILLCFGAVTAYMVLIGQIMNSLLYTIGLTSSSTDNLTRIIIIVAFLVLVWFPTCVPKEITALRYGSFLSVLGIVYIAILILIQSPAYIKDNEKFTEQINYFEVNYSIFGAIGVAVFAYDAVQNVPLIYDELQYRNPRRMKKVLFRGTALLMVLYLILGIMGYLSHVENPPKIIAFRPTLPGVTEDTDWPMVVGRVLVVFYLNVSVPLNTAPCRASVEFFITGNHDFANKTRYYLETVIILVLATILAIVMPDAVVYFQILGGLLCVPLCFTLPAMIYWKVKPHDAYNVTIMVLAVIMSLLGIACVVDTVLTDIIGLKYY